MFKIRNKIISIKTPPFVIAEMSGNHNGSLKTALKIVDLAAQAGADAIKIQTYTPDTITMKSSRKEFFIADKKNIWRNNSLYSLYKKAHTPWDWHQEIFDRAKKNKLIYFSSPFDETAVDFLETLNVPLYKVASFENNHFPLLKRIAKTGKPVIMSTGLASLNDIKEAVKYLKMHGCRQLALLKCTSSYPSNPKDLNLLTIKKMKNLFKCEVGFSDHSLGIGAAISAINFGATIVEKHFTLNKYKGVDSKFSSEVEELKMLKKETEVAWQAKGNIFFGPTNNEIKFKKFRRSIYISKNIMKGEAFSKDNLKIIRPAYGLHPKYFDRIVGKISKNNIKLGTPLKKKFIK